MHSRVAHPWTIAELADEVGISRSALVERSTRYLSEPHDVPNPQETPIGSAIA
jgi:AraC-like DNA-binding protein